MRLGVYRTAAPEVTGLSSTQVRGSPKANRIGKWSRWLIGPFHRIPGNATQKNLAEADWTCGFKNRVRDAGERKGREELHLHALRMWLDIG